MADDITLTVRVRDLSRGELARINAQVNRLDRNFRNASNSANSGSRGFNRLGNDISSLNNRFRHMLRTGDLSSQTFRNMTRDVNAASAGLRRARREGDITRNQFRAMRRDLDTLRSRLHLIGGEGNMFSRLSAHLHLLSDRLRRTTLFASHFRRVLTRIGEGSALGLARFLGVLGRLGGVLGGVVGKMAKFSRGVWIALAVILLIGPAAQALGALLVTALGGAFIALGAFALRGSAQVKSAFTEMKGTLGSVLRTAALPLQDSLVAGMAQVSVAARQMQPALTQAFTAAAPLVQDFIGAITDLGQQAMPGIIAALQHSQGAMAGFRTAMGAIGKGFGDMFRIITQGNEEELARAWVTLGEELGNVLRSLGEFISTAMNSGTATMMMIGIFRTFTGALNLVAGALRALDTIAGGFFTHLADAISGFKGLDSVVADSFANSGKSVGQLKKDLADVDEQLKQLKSRQPPSIPGMGRPKNTDVDKEINELQTKRAGILSAIKTAEEANSRAVAEEAMSYQSLVQAIQSLADLNRNYLDAQAAQQQAIIDAKNAIKDAKKNHENYSHALKMNKGQLDLTTESGIKAYEMLSKIGQNTKEATDKAIAAKAPWDQVNKNWKDGYDNIVSLADGMGLSKEQAQQLATTILGLPPSTDVQVNAKVQSALTGIDAVIAQLKATPNAKKVTVTALSAEAVRALEDLGFKVTRLPNGKFSVEAKTADAKTNIDTLQAARDALQGKSITLTTHDRASGILATVQRMRDNLTGKHITVTATYRTVFETIGNAPSTTAENLRRQAERLSHSASGGKAGRNMRRLAAGGSASGFVLDGPGTTTSDSIPARLSRGEFVMRAAAVRQYGAGFMQRVNQGLFRLPGFRRGGKVSKAQRAAQKLAKSEREARGEAVGELTISHFGKMAGYKNDEFRHNLGLPEALGGLVDSLNHWRSVIKKTTHGGLEKSLLRQLDKAGKSLIKYEKNLTKVNSSLEKAKDKLSSLKQAAASLRDSVTSGVLSATNITRVAGNDKNVTLSDVMGAMRESVDKSSAFSGALATLKKRGVSGTIIQQIAEAGIEGGGLETATALLQASDSEIASINEMQKRINKNAKDAGKTAADAMYAAGIKAAQGLVDGLTKKKKDIEKAMMNIAKAMEKAIKKALKIHSPSKVMQEVGHYTAEGFAVGIKKNPSVDTAWTSMLSTGSPGGGAYAGGASGSGHQVIQVCIGNKVIDEIVLDSGRRVVRTRGGNVQAVFGR